MAISNMASFFISSPEQNDSMPEARSQYRVRCKFCTPCATLLPTGNQEATSPAAWSRSASRLRDLWLPDSLWGAAWRMACKTCSGLDTGSLLQALSHFVQEKI